MTRHAAPRDRRRDLGRAIELLPDGFGWDYLLSGVVVSGSWCANYMITGHLHAPSDLSARRSLFGSTMTASFAVIVAVQTWTTATQNDKSAEALEAKATLGRQMSSVRYSLITEAMLLVVGSAVCLLMDKPHGRLSYVIWGWLFLAGALLLGLLRNVRLQYRLHRRSDDAAADATGDADDASKSHGVLDSGAITPRTFDLKELSLDEYV